MVDFDSDRVKGRSSRDMYLVPVRAEMGFCVGCFDCQAQGGDGVGTVWETEGDGPEEDQALRATHHEGGQHRFTY